MDSYQRCRRYTISLVGAGLMVLLFLTGCNQAQAQAVTGPNFSQQTGNQRLNLTLTPYPPPVLEEIELQLTLTSTQGQPLTGLTPTFDLTMPDMPMPPNRPLATALAAAPGTYQSRTILTMPGRWQVDIYLNPALSGDPIATFEFEAVN